MRRFFKGFILAILVLLIMMPTRMEAGPKGGEIPAKDMAIGGITFGASEDYVKSIYGEPSDISYDSNGVWGKTKTYQYGSSFFIKFGQTGNVIELKSTANNGLKTPQGFTVGIPLSEVASYYENKGSTGKKDGKKYCVYQADWYKYMKYVADKKGKIASIHLYMSP